MDDTKREHYSKKISTSLEKTVDEIKTMREQTKPIAPSEAIGRLSRMEAINEKSVKEETLRKLQVKEKALKSAQYRVTTDDYGICMTCEEEISKKRLEAVPESIVCIDCLNKAQKNPKPFSKRSF